MLLSHYFLLNTLYPLLNSHCHFFGSKKVTKKLLTVWGLPQTTYGYLGLLTSNSILLILILHPFLLLYSRIPLVNSVCLHVGCGYGAHSQYRMTSAGNSGANHTLSANPYSFFKMYFSGN